MAKISKSSKKFKKKHLKHVIAQRHKLRPMKKALQREKKEIEGRTSIKAGEELLKTMQGTYVKEPSEQDFWDAEMQNKDFDEEESSYSEDTLLTEDDENEFVDITPPEQKYDDVLEDNEKEDILCLSSQNQSLLSEIEKHKLQLQNLQEKDPEFFQFLKEHDKDLLEFNEDEIDSDDTGDEASEKAEAKFVEQSVFNEAKDSHERDQDTSVLILSSALVDTWCQAIKDKQHMGALRNLIRAFRTACHYGDGQDDLASKYNICNSHVFNKIMIFTLSEMDGVFRKYLQLDDKLEKAFKGMQFSDIQRIPSWKKLEPLVKSYFGNALHILNQMTDNQMIAYTLRRLQASIFLLGLFPKFARKYLKVSLRFWGTGQGALSLISFLFVRDIALWLGTEYLELCLKGIYKEFAANSRFINVSVLPHLHFMGNCAVELYGIDLIASYQHAFVLIRELAIVFRNALTMKSKDSYKNVYSCQYMNCLDLWVKVLCTYASKKDLQPLVYPLSQIILGVARLLPTARYFPLRLRCVKMLNKLASGTGTFIPAASLLLDMLQFKELRVTPTGSVEKVSNFNIILKITKPTLKTRGFQDECVSTVMEQLVEHLAQYSYEIAFPELTLIPLLRLRNFLKDTKVGHFRRQVKQIVDVIEHNVEYVGKRRDNIKFSPKDASSVSSFLQVEKEAMSSPLSQFALMLRKKSEQRQAGLRTSSMLISDWDQNKWPDVPEDIKEDAVKFCNSEWPPQKYLKGNKVSFKTSESAITRNSGNEETEQDMLMDLELSSDDDDDADDENTATAAAADDDKSKTKRKWKNAKGSRSLKSNSFHGTRGKTNMERNQRTWKKVGRRGQTH